MHATVDAEAPSRPTAKLHVRSLAPAGASERQAAVIDRLEELVSRSVLADLHVSVWGEQVTLAGEGGRTATGVSVRERIADVRSWAEENGRTLEPFFETRERQSAVTGADDTVLVLPVLLLAEYRDGAVTHVAPSADGATVYTVADRLTKLEAAQAEMTS